MDEKYAIPKLKPGSSPPAPLPSGTTGPVPNNLERTGSDKHPVGPPKRD